jgi:hypothetical protein
LYYSQADVKTSLKVVSINDRAVRDLRYIRDTMERAGSFTAVPGWGFILMGATALITTAVAFNLISQQLWFLVWMGEAIVASVIGILGTLRKAKTQRAFLQGPGRKFAMSLLPALVGWGHSHRSAIPVSTIRPDAGCLAAAVRRRGHELRHILCEGCTHYGRRLYRSWCSGAVGAVGMGTVAPGDGVSADYRLYSEV